MSTSNALLHHKPSRIAALMELYERNYLLLEQLVPELELPFNQATSTSTSDPPLHLIALERGRYTSAFRLTYEIDGRCEPDMWVKVYRDARLAESLYCAARPRWLAGMMGDAGQDAQMPQRARDGGSVAAPEVRRYLGEQWARNLTLQKWLQYLLEQGHGFGMAARPRKCTSL
jgi:uncharacterized protein YqiB (DUF1249 family)